MSSGDKMEPTVGQLFDLSDRVALVTGGTGWLGSAFSRALAEAGAVVVVSSRDTDRAVEAAGRLPSPGGAVHHGVALDHTDPDAIGRGFAEAVAVAGKVDVLVNNGLDACPFDLTDCTFEQFAAHQRNTAGYFELARLLRNHVVEREAEGSVILLGSMYGQVASYPDAYRGVAAASPVAYHAHKGGVIHMTRHLAAYYAADGVRVNCISPGPFPNDDASVEMVSRLSTKLPMQRMGRPHELKGVLMLLASDAGSFITGQNLTVDGGWTSW